MKAYQSTIKFWNGADYILTKKDHDRIWSHIKIQGSHWITDYSRNSAGEHKICLGGRTVPLSMVLHQMYVGSNSPGCPVKNCVNPHNHRSEEK